MRSYGRLGLFAAAAVASFLFIDVLLAAGGWSAAQAAYGVGLRIGLYGIAAVSAAMAASTFGWWREQVGRPWTLFFVEYALLLVNYLIRRTSPGWQTALDVTLIVANLAQIGAYSLVCRSLRAAGIGSLLPRGRRIALTFAALAVALVISHASLADMWRMIGTGDARASSVIALLTDVITFTLIAPLAMSTIALRGGQLFWIFGFLTISVFGWMFNEAGPALAGQFMTGDDTVRMTRMIGIAVAALFNAAAATTQWASARRAVRGMVVDG